MRICMLSAFYHPITAGSEVFTKEISERLVAGGHEVHVVTGGWLKFRRTEDVKGVHVHRVPSVLLKNLALPSVVPGMFFRGLKVARGCDIVHAHLAFPPGFTGAMIKKLTGKPLVTTVQGGDVGIYPQSGLGRFFPLIRPCVGWGLRSSDKVTAISGFLAGKSEELGAKGVVLVRNGTDTKRFNPEVPFGGIKEKYKIRGGPVILTVSRLVPKNGTHILIPAFAKVVKEIPGALLVIAGDGPERGALEKQASGLGLGGSVRFLGYIAHDEIPALMNLADLFVRVSLEEGLGIVFTEAMACKTPVVATKVGGIPDIVKDGENGLLVPPGDIEATSAAISRVLLDPKLAEKLVSNGRSLIDKEFSWDSIYRKMLSVYEGVLK